MRKLTSYLLMSLDGVVESPNRFVRDDMYQDVLSLIGATIAEQDAVLLGRKMYDEWSTYWPQSTIEPFATFINSVPKYVVSHARNRLDWEQSHHLCGDIRNDIATLKAEPGKTIGVHGSISLVQSLLTAGLLDELRFVVFPVVVGNGRRLLSQDVEPVQLDLESARSLESGLQFLTYRPRSSL
jgi:dihydrofolate reductase